jgi:uncharacterized protein (TIGR02246 family)
MRRAVFTLAALGAATGAAAAADDVRAAIDRGNAAYLDALERGDADAMAALFTPDGIQLPENQAPLRGREAIRAGYAAAFPRLKFTGGSIVTSDLTRDGNVAVEVGAYVFTVSVKDKPPQTLKGRYLTIWRYAGGAWRIMADSGNSDAPV